MVTNPLAKAGVCGEWTLEGTYGRRKTEQEIIAVVQAKGDDGTGLGCK